MQNLLKTVPKLPDLPGSAVAQPVVEGAQLAKTATEKNVESSGPSDAAQVQINTLREQLFIAEHPSAQHVLRGAAYYSGRLDEEMRRGRKDFGWTPEQNLGLDPIPVDQQVQVLRELLEEAQKQNQSLNELKNHVATNPTLSNNKDGQK